MNGPVEITATVPSDVLAAIEGRGWSAAVAESLTGGAVCDALVGVPGASRVLRGGVVAYATAVKASVLGVDPRLLAARGAVDPDVALAMARGVRRLLEADVGISTTGVAGPDPQDGAPVGTVFVAVATPSAARVREVRLDGDRAQIRAGAVREALALTLEMTSSDG